MLQIQRFIFNPIEENTYLLFDETKEAVIIDCGASTDEEQKQVSDFLVEKDLKLKHLLNTHIHFDHVLGNQFICETYGLKPQYHRAEEAVFGLGKLNVLFSPVKYKPIYAEHFLEHEEEIRFGNTRIKALFTPGHSLGGLCFYFEQDRCLFSGDTLFYHDIGRTDLLGGNHSKLIQSIKNHLFTLPESTVVYPGHALPTTIGEEKLNNPYF